MLGQLEDQGKEIVEKVNHIRALQEQMEAKEVGRGAVWCVMWCVGEQGRPGRPF